MIPLTAACQGLPVPHHLLELAQIHVHCSSEAIQPSHLLTPSSPFAFHLSQHQGLFQWIICSYQVTIIVLSSPSNSSSSAEHTRQLYLTTLSYFSITTWLLVVNKMWVEVIFFSQVDALRVHFTPLFLFAVIFKEDPDTWHSETLSPGVKTAQSTMDGARSERKHTFLILSLWLLGSHLLL